jgi:hypothetical protein
VPGNGVAASDLPQLTLQVENGVSTVLAQVKVQKIIDRENQIAGSLGAILAANETCRCGLHGQLVVALPCLCNQAGRNQVD